MCCYIIHVMCRKCPLHVLLNIPENISFVHEIYNVLTALLMIMQEMHFLRHKKLTSKQGAARGGSNQTGFSDGGIQSNRSKGNQGV